LINLWFLLGSPGNLLKPVLKVSIFLRLFKRN
jgi:hypothetical protein